MRSNPGRSSLLIFLMLASLAHGFTGIAFSQNATQHVSPKSPTQQGPAKLPSFEVISIRPIPPGSKASWGFRSLPGGRVDIGAIDIRQLMSIAFSVPASRVEGGPEWLSTEGYAILATPPDTSSSRTNPQSHESFTATAEQRLMLQSMLANRFSLRCHEETRLGSSYILTKGNGPLKLNPPQDTARQPAFVLFMRGITYDGAIRGANVSMPLVAEQLSADLNSPVIDNTGLTGSYDFEVQPFAPENEDVEFAAIGAMRQLGLNLKKASAPARVIVIDTIQRPTPN